MNTTGMSCWMATPISWAVIRKSPSPGMQATWRSGAASLAPMAAGTGQPIDEKPPVVRWVRGS